MRLAITLVAAMLVACGQSDKPHKATSAEKKTPTVEELVADPEQLKKLRQQCKTDRPTLGELLCNRVAEATRKRFYGDGKTPYTPPKESPKLGLYAGIPEISVSPAPVPPRAHPGR